MKSGVMRLGARKYSLIGRCFISAPRAMPRYLSYSVVSIDKGYMSSRRSDELRFYCSKPAAALNADEGGHRENTAEDNEEQPGRPSTESVKTTSSRLSQRGARFRDAFLSKIVPWEEIPVSFDKFPYYTDEDTKSLLVECLTSHLKRKEFRKYGGNLKQSSNRIQLQSLPGTDLYRERLVSAVARELQVPLLKLDSSILPPYDISQHSSTLLEVESDDESDEDEDEDEDEDDDDDEDEDDATDEDEDKQNLAKPDNVCLLKKGDRVKYNGKAISIKEVKNRILPYGHRGEVHEVKGDKVAVIFNDCGLTREEAEEEEEEGESTETIAQETVTWLDAKDVKHMDDAPTHDCFIAMELLYEVLKSRQPIIVYFPDTFYSILSEASWQECHEFCYKTTELIDNLSGCVVLICGKNKRKAGSKEMEKFPDYTKEYNKGLRGINKIFTNVMCIQPPKDEDLDTFIKQIEEDKTTVISEGNLSLMHQVLKAHRLLCTDLEQANTTDMILTREEVEKIVAWATNHYISSCPLPCVKEDLLHVPHESIKLAILRLTTSKEMSVMPKKSFKDLAKGRHEKQLVSSVICAGDIGVKFDDVGALENVKMTLHETLILPLKRPELFSHGNLKRTCNGVLLYGPPGTGKTLMAKALATEAGANFINVTTATLASKMIGKTEKLTRALFTYARKLAPAIIFVDEVDSLLGTRGDNEYDTSRVNEFMAAWDGLLSKDSQRILVIGATNRPFDLDDAIIRRMPRRIYVGLPDADNRKKILMVLLSEENLEFGFSVEQLADATEGYSGSDLKNLCVAAAYRPVQELLERESKVEKSEGATALRPLNIDDYIHCKAQVRPSVSCDASSIEMLRKWDKQYGEGGNRGSRLQDLAKGRHEKRLVSSVICAGDIGVTFDDVGALENVKKTLHETVILPLKRPELFSHGNLKRTCKGVLLFGPSGTGKTLMAKALATEAGANFINVTTATLTSKWVGETERLTRALFTYARKLAPVIIFVDEVDSLLGARGHDVHDTSRLNEFMAAWDGLISKDSQRILVIGATNRPFDLDNAIIRRMPRRIYVGLPDADNRKKILKVLLSEENLEVGFSVEQLAEATQGYSGSDLKNLCVAAAYRPVQELLERESKVEKSEGATALRPLNIDDYIHCKAQVRPSVSCDASSIKMLQEWDEQYGEGGGRRLPFGF